MKGKNNYMDLLYIWNGNICDTVCKNTGYSLNSKYNISYDKKLKKLDITQNTLHIPYFFGKNIFDIQAIVGENGAGKTRLLKYIIETINIVTDFFYVKTYDFFILFYDGIVDEKNKIICYTTNEYADISCASDDIKFIVYNLSNSNFKPLNRYKIGYFTNAFSLSDYQSLPRANVYNASTGALILKDFNSKFEMHQISKENTNIIYNYFFTEKEAIINFLYSDLFKNFYSQKFPNIKKLEIIITKYFLNLASFVKRLKSDLKNKNDNEIEEIRLFFKKAFNNFNECEWITHCILNIMLNIMRVICIKQTSNEDRKKDFLDLVLILKEYTANTTIPAEDIFAFGINLLKKMQKQIDSKYIVKEEYTTSIKFIEWIKNQKDIFLCSSQKNICTIQIGENQNLILKLITYYQETNFSFLYLNFDFGVSSGELAFLNLYANLRGKKFDRFINDDRKIYNQKSSDMELCKNVLLIFDEADMLFHPRWQQQYLQLLTDFISFSISEEISVQVLIATHSPILLSDFPSQNVIYLQNGKAITKSNQTFGCNIYKMFLDSFFLDKNGLMGEFAHNKINKIAEKLLSNSSITEDEYKIISYIGDEILQNYLYKIYKKKNHENEYKKLAD